MQKTNTPAPEKQKPNYMKWGYNILVGIAVLFLLSGFFLKNDKIAYVDSANILNEYKGSADAKKAYESKAKVWQDNIDTLTGEVKVAIQKYEKSMATMSKREQE